MPALSDVVAVLSAIVALGALLNSRRKAPAEARAADGQAAESLSKAAAELVERYPIEVAAMRGEIAGLRGDLAAERQKGAQRETELGALRDELAIERQKRHELELQGTTLHAQLVAETRARQDDNDRNQSLIRELKWQIDVLNSTLRETMSERDNLKRQLDEFGRRLDDGERENKGTGEQDARQ